MPQHVRMNREGKPCSTPCSLNHPQEPNGGDWRACFSGSLVLLLYWIGGMLLFGVGGLLEKSYYDFKRPIEPTEPAP
jgi:hypothetical protein